MSLRLRRIVSPEFEGGIYFRKEHYAHDPELMEAYECGWRDAMRKVYDEDEYHERRGTVTHRGGDGSRILYRHDDEWDDDEIEYRRRRRDSMGRYR